MRPLQRREIEITAGGVVLGSLGAVYPQAAQVQSPMPRVTLVHTGSMRNGSAVVDALHKRLRELQYTEGKNLIFEVRELDGRLEQLPKIMAEIVQTQPNVILVRGSLSVRATMAATKTIPIVATTVGDVLAQGFAESLARPGKNLTGNALISEASNQKPLEILHEIVSGATRAAFLSDAINPGAAGRKKLRQEAAAARSLTPVFLHASNLEDLQKAFAETQKQRVQMMVVGGDPFFAQNASALVKLAALHRLPTV